MTRVSMDVNQSVIEINPFDDDDDDDDEIMPLMLDARVAVDEQSVEVARADTSVDRFANLQVGDPGFVNFWENKIRELADNVQIRSAETRNKVLEMWAKLTNEEQDVFRNNLDDVQEVEASTQRRVVVGCASAAGRGAAVGGRNDAAAAAGNDSGDDDNDDFSDEALELKRKEKEMEEIRNRIKEKRKVKRAEQVHEKMDALRNEADDKRKKALDARRKASLKRKEAQEMIRQAKADEDEADAKMNKARTNERKIVQLTQSEDYMKMEDIVKIRELMEWNVAKQDAGAEKRKNPSVVLASVKQCIECVICSDVCKEEIFSCVKCDTVMCRDCLETWREEKKPSECPTCRVDLTKNPAKRNRLAERIVNEM